MRSLRGASSIELYHEKISVNAAIHTINGFSAHADQTELLEWMSAFEDLKKVYLIHGEEDKQCIFQTAIKEHLDKEAHIIEEEEYIEL